MLVDLPATVATAKRVYRGIYLAHLNFHLDLRGLVADQWPDFPVTSTFCGYGVVDHWTQLPLQDLMKDPRPLMVYLTRVRADEQPPNGGWRWHKWGPYLGVHEVSQEYLFDTPGVSEVWCFQAMELKASGYQKST